MKTISTLLTCLFPLLLLAQSYTISPSAIRNINLTLDEYDGTQVSFRNNLNKTLDLEWQLVSNDLMNGWDYSLCDYGSCYAGVPNSGVMDPVAVGDSGFLKMNITPLNIDGSGQVKLIVFETGSTTAPDTIVFNYNTIPTGIKDNTSALASISVFPNPASDFIYVKNLNEPTTISLMDITGKIIHRSVSSNNKESISVSHLSKGVYFVAIENIKGYKQTHKIIISK